jgi:hypothetical protein
MPIVAVDIIDPPSGVLPPTLGTFVGERLHRADPDMLDMYENLSIPSLPEVSESYRVRSVADHRHVPVLVAPPGGFNSLAGH